MKNTFCLFLVALVGVVFSVSGQNVSGNWYGVGQVKRAGEHSNYLCELIITQKGIRVTGEFNYYFKSAEVKTKVSGTYNNRLRLLELNANPLLNYQAKNINGADCPMESSLTFRISKLESSLTGQFNPLFDYRFTCPAINIKFVKQTTIPLPPLTDDEVEDSIPPAEIPKPIIKQDPVIVALNQRVFEASPVIDVDADSLKVTLYDNGEVDHDTISVFYNRKLVAYKQMLSDKPISFVLPLDTAVNEITMFAENLGSIPPNTAVAVIYANDQRFELGMTSTFIKNATIRFRRKIKVKDPKNIN